MVARENVVSGKIGQAISFDGIDDVVTATRMSVTEGASRLTWSFWGKTKNFVNNRSFIAKDTYASSGSWRIDVASNCSGTQQLLVYVPVSSGDNTTYGCADIPSPTLNTWHHYVAVFDGTKTGNAARLRIWVDGVEDISLDYGGTIPATTAVSANNVTFGNDSGSTRLTGEIDDVRIYTRALSPNEITKLYKVGSEKLGISSKKLDQSLFLYWSFNGDAVSGSTVNDVSGHGYNTTIAGFTTVERGIVGQGLFFPSTIIDNGSSFTPGYVTQAGGVTKLTMMLWLKPTELADSSSILNQDIDGPTTGWNFEFGSALDGGNDDVVFYPAAGARGVTDDKGYTTSNILVRNEWVHLAVVFNGFGLTNAQKLKIYKNGVEQTLSFNGTIPSTVESAVGGGLYVGLDPLFGGLYRGYVDEIRMYSRSLTASEVMDLYQSGAARINTSPKSISSGLVGYWTFDGKNMIPNVIDSSNNSNHGTLVSFTTSPSVLGKVGQGISFPGITGSSARYISVARNTSLNPVNGVSVCAWMIYRGGTNNGIISKSAPVTDVSTSQPDYGFILVGAGQIRWVMNGQLGSVQSSVGALPVGVWKHVCGTYDLQNMILYIDGVNVASSPYTTAILDSGSSQLYMGVYYSTTYSWDGVLDDARVYNRALTANEVKRIYNQTK
jgi:hypothetical protein